MLVHDAEEDDLPQILEIVNAWLPTTTIEWTDTPYTLNDRTLWLRAHQRAGEPVLVAEVDHQIAGFASYGDFRDAKKWPGYRFTVEHTVHVHERHWGRGGASADGGVGAACCSSRQARDGGRHRRREHCIARLSRMLRLR